MSKEANKFLMNKYSESLQPTAKSTQPHVFNVDNLFSFDEFFYKVCIITTI